MMNFRHLFLVLSFIFLLSIFSFGQDQEIITVQGEAQVEFPLYKSELEVRREAQQQAEINALERAFGVAVFESNLIFLQDVTTREKSKTTSVFHQIGNTFVKGEVIERKEKKFTISKDSVEIDGKIKIVKGMKCQVKITARELVESPIDFEVFPLKCLDIDCKSFTFLADSNDFYLYFHSPTSGYLTVFIDDGIIAQRLFPYRSMKEEYQKGVPLNANKEYYLFSRDKKLQYFDGRADEYVFKTNKPIENNKLFIIFSRTPITQPFLKEKLKKDPQSNQLVETELEVPQALPSRDFQKWLVRSRILNRNIKVAEIIVTIERPSL